jgi:ABC-type glycerol-3-phosphate transport system substrate-binding protein
MIVLQILKSKEMKKIAFMFAVATMFVACGGNANKAAEEAPADSTIVEEVVDTNAVDTNAVDTAAVDTVNA